MPSTVKREPTFEEVWTDVYWVFAHDDMAFDYRASYFKERHLKVRHGVVDFEKLTISREQ